MISYIVLLKILASLFIGRFIMSLILSRKSSKKKIGTLTFLYYISMFALMGVAVWINY